ncbi:NAD-dependent epimerase/dehydratase family protein [Nitrospirillum viridazoti]|uniref:NAD(P)H steroid dehydrogenase n=1 Tax=Nitrospirillum viridazoti CBAmc TaxID=1441467 RepID=A0A248K256_9PROT|nr:NAD(P)-dependent oxidoreductase [Nitrospirillum amazonense]ASG25055.1 NAD(P)H steroid dehydrogenase [Nitrospirillum amazonense CBAmc]TWB26182.1 nucleoside-diphosphate-sugar epimerase [Nitrospirillum amazonense]
MNADQKMAKAGRVLITGTSGFLGGALGRHLRGLGWEVTGLSRSAARSGSVDHQILHDLSRPLPPDLPRHDVVIHAAALASPWAPPAAYQANILDATAHLLRYVQDKETSQFIFISTTAVFYILGDQFDLTEDSPFPTLPANLYAAAKREAERLVLTQRSDALILRPRAIYGPGDTVLFPRILRAAAKGMLPRIVRPDGGTAVADMVYIGNLVHAIERSITLRISGTINITDASPQETDRLLGSVLSRLGYPPPRLRIPVAAAMRAARVAEQISARLLGWREPPITRFGVSAVAHSKTFDVTRMLSLLGPPPFTPEQGFDAFIDWQKAGAVP